ncbi:MAG: S8 family peptidase [Chromatiales bacterium]|jgi:serine protease
MMYYKHLHRAISACLIITSMVLTGSSQAGVHKNNVDAQAVRARLGNVTNRIIVKYRDGATGGDTSVKTLANRISINTGRTMTHMRTMGTGAQVFKIGETLPIGDIQEVVQQLEADPNVEYAEPDTRAYHFFTPSDSRYNEQWNFIEDTVGIGMPEAWDSTQGEGVVVAMIDTGYLEHADLVDNLLLPGYDFMSDISMSNDGDGRDADAADPGDFSPECDIPQSTWHGTHTAGTVAAVTDNGTGVTGIAFKAKVLPVRVLGKCGGYMSEIADGLLWAAGGSISGVPENENPAQVINVSLGGDASSCSQTMQSAVDQARQLGATIVVAAGNFSEDASGIEPANCYGVITVAASNKSGAFASYSNFGDVVDISAPGVDVLSTHNTGTISPGRDSYYSWEGTSMATPHVSGVAALLYSLKPDITPDEVEQILEDTATPFTSSCRGCGAGIVNAAAAVDALSVTNLTTTPTPTPIATPSSELVVLENGVTESGLEGEPDTQLMFAIDVPDGATGLNFNMSGGSGDADLFVRFGEEPTSRSYDCRPYRSDNDEGCDIEEAQQGRYYAMIDGYRAFSDVSLVASYIEETQTPTSTPTPTPMLTPTPTPTPTPTSTPTPTPTPMLTPTPTPISEEAQCPFPDSSSGFEGIMEWLRCEYPGLMFES